MNDLFSGVRKPMGGLLDERELVGKCPGEFFVEDNPWSKAAIGFAYKPWHTSTELWQWRTKDSAEQEKQKDCIRAVGTSFWLTYEGKKALTGWMLSMMVSEIPL